MKIEKSLVCKSCGIEYLPTYGNRKSAYHKTDFCSKQCAAWFMNGGLTSDKIESEIELFIISKNRYCDFGEICSGIKRSSKTLRKYKVNHVLLNERLGFFRSYKVSVFQEKIYTFLCNKYSDITCEYTNSKLLSPKGYNLRIDFYIPSIHTFIEADGKQHYDKNHMWFSEYLQECDRIKDNFALELEAKMIRIPYKDSFKDSYILDFLD